MPSIPPSIAPLKVCLVTDWLTNLGGGEKVVKAISDLFPEAPIYTTVVNKKNIGGLAKRDIRTSYLQKIPGAAKRHQKLLPMLPKAMESLDVSEYDLVLSFSSAIAKSVKTHDKQLHVCYIHTPARYAWEPAFDPRVQNLPFFLKPAAKSTLKKIKKWDYETRNRPDFYIANSTTVQKRVRKYYDLDTAVLYPPVSMREFKISPVLDLPEKDYYFAIGRMVPYKKFPLVAEAFAQMGRPLIIGGDGPELARVQMIAAKAPNITVLGRISRRELVQRYRDAKALILPQEEDAGIVQLESFAAGTPVIAYNAGGVRDVLEEGVNGVFFEEQSIEGIVKGVKTFEKSEQNFSSERVSSTVEKYDVDEFQRKYLAFVESFWLQKKKET